LERRNLSLFCVGSPLVFLIVGLDYPEGRPPAQTRCERCGEYHGRVVLHEGEDHAPL
jgi:hypothetical protein